MSSTRPLRFVLFSVTLGACWWVFDSFAHDDAHVYARLFGSAAIDAIDGRSVQSVAPTSALPSHVLGCPRGGDVTFAGGLAGSLDAGGTGTLTLDAREAIDGCAITSALDGRMVADGRPGLTLVGTFRYAGQVATARSVAMTGAFRWRDEDRSGTCDVDATLQLVDASHDHATLHGAVCGHGVDVSW